MLRLADTSIRLYRRKDQTVSVRLRSHIMIHAKEGGGFRLSTHLNHFDCSVTFESGQQAALNDYSFTYDCLYRMDHMIHEFWASGIVHLESIFDGAARLQINYRLFSLPERLDIVVPVLARGAKADRFFTDLRNPLQQGHD